MKKCFVFPRIFPLLIGLLFISSLVSAAYDVRFYSAEGLCENISIEDNVQLSDPCSPLPVAGYDFVGWTAMPVIDESDVELVEFPMAVTENCAFYAVYQENGLSASRFVKCDSPDQIVDGRYILVATKDGVIYCMGNNFKSYQAPNILLNSFPDSPDFELSSNDTLWTIRKMATGTFVFCDENGYYMHSSSSGMSLDVGAFYWIIEPISVWNNTGDGLLIRSDGTGSRAMRPNTNNNNITEWRSYPKTTFSLASSIYDIYLYRETPPEPGAFTSFPKTETEKEELASVDEVQIQKSDNGAHVGWTSIDGATHYIVSLYGTDGNLESRFVTDEISADFDVRYCVDYYVSVLPIDLSYEKYPSVEVSHEALVSPEIIFDANGGTLPDGSDKIEVSCGEEHVVLPMPEYAGLVFAGWDDMATADVETYPAGEFPLPNRDIILKALWRDLMEYTVNYMVDGQKNTIKYKENELVTEPDAPKVDGFNFIGWTVDSVYEHSVSEFYTFNVQPLSDTTLYALFASEEYNVSPLVQMCALEESFSAVVVQRVGDEFYALLFDEKLNVQNEAELLTKTKNITSFISGVSGAYSLSVDGIAELSALFAFDKIDSDYRVKSLNTNYYMSAPSGSFVLNGGIPLWSLKGKENVTDERDLNTYLIVGGSPADRRWALFLGDKTWKNHKATTSDYSEGNMILFRVPQNSIAGIEAHFTTRLSLSTDTVLSPMLSATSFYDHVYLEWNRVAGAKGYRLNIPALGETHILDAETTDFKVYNVKPGARCAFEIESIPEDSDVFVAKPSSAFAVLQGDAAAVRVVGVSENYFDIEIDERLSDAKFSIRKSDGASKKEIFADEVFFSKYFTADNTYKVSSISIYNGTDKAVSLDSLRISAGDAGGDWSGSISLRYLGNEKPGYIMPGEEITITSKGTKKVDYDILNGFDASLRNKWIMTDDVLMRYTGLSTLVLEKCNQDGSWSFIDVIGSVSGGRPGNKPANLYGWTHDNVPDMNGTMARSSTNSSLLIRRNSVLSGTNAVTANTDDFKTLSSEWMAMAMPKMEVDEIREQRLHITELMRFMAGYDYNDYYMSSGSEEELRATSLNDSKLRFSVSVNDYAGNEVSLSAEKDDLAFSVDLNLPVVVGAEMSAEGMNHTDSELFQMRNCDVVVMSGSVLNHTAQNTANLKNVYLLSDAELNIADNNTLQIDRLHIYVDNNGTPEVKNYEDLKSVYPMRYVRKITSGSSCFISLPYNTAVNDITLENGLLGVVGGSWRVKRYDGMFRSEYGADAAGKASAWVELSRNDTLMTGVGYLFESDVQGDSIFVFRDSKNGGYTPDGLVSISRNRYRASSDNRHSGWNFIGVPYISSFNGALIDVSKNNTIPYISVTDGNNGDFNQDFTEDIILSPLSCLFVQSEEDSDMLLDKSKLELSPYKSVSLRLILKKDNVAADRTVVAIDEYAPEKEYRIGHDLEKISNYDAKSRIYTIDHGGRLAVNALPSVMINNIPVGVYFEKSGTYTISLDETMEGYYKYVILTDKKTNKRVNLKNAAYVFATNTSEQVDDRFLLSISDTSTKQNAIEENGVSVYYNEGKICLSNLSGKAAISVYDAVGRTLVPEFEHSDSVCYIDGLPSGMYIVRVRYYAGEAVSLKVICY